MKYCFPDLAWLTWKDEALPDLALEGPDAGALEGACAGRTGHSACGGTHVSLFLEDS